MDARIIHTTRTAEFPPDATICRTCRFGQVVGVNIAGRRGEEWACWHKVRLFPVIKACSLREREVGSDDE